MRRIRAFTLATLLTPTCAFTQSPLDQVWQTVTRPRNNSTTAALSNDKITAGLKEALKVSTGRAVASTGRRDGFLKNEAIKILLPPKLQSVGRGLRMIGMGERVDGWKWE